MAVLDVGALRFGYGGVMGIEGHLSINLRIDSELFSSIQVKSSHSIGASRLFHDKTMEEALKIVPNGAILCGYSSM